MAQQTAVEWLFDQLKERGYVFTYAGEFPPHLLFEQAKQIEKEQSKQDYDAGLFDGTMDDVKDRLYKNAEQYYNETYKK
jgi:hypothetical protein